MNLSGTQLKDTYGNLLTIGTTAGSPQTGTLQNGDGQDITSLTLAGDITASKNQNATSSFTFQNTDTTSTNVRTHLNATAGNRSVRLEAIHSDYSYLVSNNARLYLQTNSSSNNPLYLDGNNVIFNGQVGIGTTLPNASLHISQNPPVLALGSTGTSDPRLDFYDQGTTTIGASIFLDQDEDILCLLRTASGSATDGIRIDSSGNVGIGTSSPSGGKLHIDATSTPAKFESSTTTLYNTYTNSNGNFGFIGSGSGVASGGSADDFGVQAVNNFVFATGGSTERMRIDSSGKVGIGTDSPIVALDVVGTIRGGIANKKGTYTDGDTTPSVAGISYLRIANTGATTITNFDDATEGQVIYLEFADSNTTVNRSNAYLSGGTNFTSSAYDMLVLFYSSYAGQWHEISRSVNS